MPLAPGLVICVFLVLASSACQRPASRATESEPPIPVATEPVQLGNMVGVVSATAVVEGLPGADFTAIAPAPGRIVELARSVGDRVQAGDVLVRFEFPSLRAEIDARAVSIKNADLRLRNAKAQQDRVRALVVQGAASRRESDDADAEVNAAETDVAQLRTAQVTADALNQRTTIRAPFTGVVTERQHKPGELVGSAPEDVILRIIDPHQVQVVASVPVVDSLRFAIGASARGTTDTKARPESLRVISRPEPEAGATAVPVRLAFLESTELGPGVQLGVEIDAEQRSNVPLVPAIAVVTEGDESAVFVATGGQARKRRVTVGLRDAERVEIRSGLKAGEMVVTQGQSNLRDGNAITMSP